MRSQKITFYILPIKDYEIFRICIDLYGDHLTMGKNHSVHGKAKRTKRCIFCENPLCSPWFIILMTQLMIQQMSTELILKSIYKKIVPEKYQYAVRSNSLLFF